MSIGNYAFRNCSSLTDIVIPNNVMNIGYTAFSGCSGLESVSIGTGLVSIGESAFSNCSKLANIVYNAISTVDLVPNPTIFNNNGGAAVIIGDAVERIPSNLFYASNIKSVVIGQSVASIGNSAFQNCSALTSIIIPDNVSSIGASAFSGCTGLTNATIGNGLSNLPNNAFFNCSGLLSVSIPNSITGIGASAFSGCSKLAAINLPESLESVGSYAFSGCSGLTELTLPSRITSIGTYAFLNCKNVSKINWFAENVADFASSGAPFGNNFAADDIDVDIIFGDSVKRIPAYALYYVELKSIKLGRSVESIGNYAFYDCKGMTALIWNASNVTSIGTDAFAYAGVNSTGVNIVFGNTVSAIPAMLFGNLTAARKPKITSIVFGKNVRTIGDRAFMGCAGFTGISIPNSVRSIGESAFSGCTGLTSISIGSGVTSIGASAFYGLPNLINLNYNAAYVENLISTSTVFYNAGRSGDGITVTIGNAVEKIPAYLFYISSATYLPNVKSVVLGSNVKTIGDYAFYRCGGTASLAIPNSVVSIGASAFYNSTGLTGLTIGTGVTSIGSSAFYGCTGLTNINYNAINIEDLASNSSVFYNAGRSGDGINLTFGSTVERIPDYLFYQSSTTTSPNIKSVSFGNGIGSIGNSAFNNCNNLATISMSNQNTELDIRVFNNTTWYNNQPNGVIYMGNVAYEYKGTMPSNTNISLVNGTSGIAGSAFSGKTTLTGITLPEGLVTIGPQAFYGCSGLTTINIPRTVSIIGRQVFEGCTNLATITCTGNSIFEAVDNVLFNQRRDILIHYPARRVGIEYRISLNIKTISAGAFVSCANLQRLYIPASVLSIENGAIRNNSRLTIYCFGGSAAHKYAVDNGIPFILITELDITAPSGTKIALTKSSYESKAEIEFPVSANVQAVGGAGNNPVSWSCSDQNAVVIGGQSTIGMGNEWTASALLTGKFAGTYTITANTDDGASSMRTIEITSQEPAVLENKWIWFWNRLTEQASHVSVNFSDRLFEQSATEYNHDLARASMALCAASYDAAYISSAFANELKLKDCGLYHYGLNFDQYAIGHKTIMNDGQQYDLVVIVIQGTTSSLEWTSNFMIWGSDHFGFSAARDKMLSEFSAYSNKFLNNGLEKKFLITGHSRGGAIAGLFAVSLEKMGYDPDDTFVYTFGSPNNNHDGGVGGTYDNIFNIMNPRDTVPGVPPVSLGFWKYGNTLALHSVNKLSGQQTLYSVYKDKLMAELQIINGGNLSVIIDERLITSDLYRKHMGGDLSLDSFVETNVERKTQHSPAMYLAWLNIMPPVKYADRRMCRYIVVECPVDVEVYQGITLVGKITDNVIDDSIVGDVSLWIFNDTKCVELPSDEYTIRLIGTDTGTMTYSVYDVNEATGEVLTKKVWNDVALYDGKKMLSNNFDGTIEIVNLYTVDSHGEHTSIIKTDGKEVSAISYTVTLNPNGGSVSPTSVNVNNGDTFCALPIPTRGNYVFSGWYTATSGGKRINPLDTVNLTGNTTLYARWTPIAYAVTVTSGKWGGNFATGATVSIIADAPPTGQRFKQWNISPAVAFTGITNATNDMAQFFMPAQPVTATAIYEPIPPDTFAVTVTNGNGNGGFITNATVTITANTAPTGQRFKQWNISPRVTFVDGTSATSATTKFTMPTQVVTATAIYEDIPATTYAVSVNSGTGGGSFAQGAIVTITANAAPAGQRFKQWNISPAVTFMDGTSATSATAKFAMLAQAVTATAVYENLPAGQYAINVQTDGNGTASASATSASQGTEITLTASANSGYRFKQWQVISGSITISSNKFTMPASAVTVKAIFEAEGTQIAAPTIIGGKDVTLEYRGEKQLASSVTGEDLTWSSSNTKYVQVDSNTGEYVGGILQGQPDWFDR